MSQATFELKLQARALCACDDDTGAWLAASSSAREEAKIFRLRARGSDVISDIEWDVDADILRLSCTADCTVIGAVAAQPSGASTLRLWSHKADSSQLQQLNSNDVAGSCADVCQMTTDDAKMLAAMGSDLKVLTFDNGSVQVSQQCAAGTQLVSCCKSSPADANILACAGASTYHVCDLRAREPVQRVDHAHMSQIEALDLSESGNLLASTGRDGLLRVWDLRKHCAGPLHDIRAHSHWIWAVEFHRKFNQLLLTSSSDGTACLWDLSAQQDAAGSRDEAAKAASTVKHSESVYNARWAQAEHSFLWCSMSYDGHVAVNTVPSSVKNHSMLV